MSLRCKPGDLAVVIGGPITPEMIGKIVRVIRLAVPYEDLGRGLPYIPSKGQAAWVVDAAGSSIPLRTTLGNFRLVQRRAVQDRLLRPIRPGDGEDETLRWAGKPQETPADVIASEVAR